MTLSEARNEAQRQANENGLPHFVITYNSEPEYGFDVLCMYDGKDEDIIIWSEVRQQEEIYSPIWEAIPETRG